MKKIIKSSEVPGGNVPPNLFEMMRRLNLQPEFDETDKSWKFHKVLHTDTLATPWLISIEEEYFVLVQSPPGSRGTHSVSVYPSNKKGKYSISLKTMIDRLPMYVDMEAAADEFARKVYAQKLIDAEIDEEMKIIEEIHNEDLESKS